MYQPPSGGCVLKHKSRHCHGNSLEQPPSGGCVLKQYGKFRLMVMGAAAFGRLCVETLEYRSLFNSRATAAFGRLCVETGLQGLR